MLESGFSGVWHCSYDILPLQGLLRTVYKQRSGHSDKWVNLHDALTELWLIFIIYPDTRPQSKVTLTSFIKLSTTKLVVPADVIDESYDIHATVSRRSMSKHTKNTACVPYAETFVQPSQLTAHTRQKQTSTQAGLQLDVGLPRPYNSNDVLSVSHCLLHR